MVARLVSSRYKRPVMTNAVGTTRKKAARPQLADLRITFEV
jgi:hypothetical protein